MQIEQSMNGAPPVVFTPGWIDGGSVVAERDIAVENLSITRGLVATRATNSQISFSRNLQNVVVLTLEISRNGGANVLADIPFEVSGDLAREVIFNSHNQNTPWKVLLKIHSETREMSLGFTLDYSGLSVDDALAGVTFYQALASGGEFRIRGTHPITGGDVSLARGSLPSGEYKKSDPRFAKLLEDLRFIQQKTGVSFTIPEGSIRFQEAKTIAATAGILRTGHARYEARPWVSISRVEQAKNVLESFASEKSVATALHYDGEVVRILGNHVPLGPVTLFCARAYIAKGSLEALRKELEVVAPQSYLSIQFTPFEGCPIEARYIKWLPRDEADALKKLPMYMKAQEIVEDGVWTLPQVNVDAALALLQSWYNEDANEQKKSWDRLKVGLDENRLSDRKLFR